VTDDYSKGVVINGIYYRPAEAELFIGLCMTCGLLYGNKYRVPMQRIDGRCQCCGKHCECANPERFGNPTFPKYDRAKDEQ
jgi:hypothetical protein